jgi:anti-sigma regulatory factor (Ser/Thr protein kinase)
MPEANLDLLREAASARTARQFVERTLIDWHLGAFVNDATLLVSELVSNAIMHAVAISSREDLRLRVLGNPGGIRIEVVDGSHDPPVRRPVDVSGGRGLLLVDEIAARWGTRSEPGGKVVWFELGPDGAESS